MIITTPHIDPIDIGVLYEPEPVLFSFETPGWYILTAFLIAIILFVFIKWFKNYKKNAYRREALKNLGIIKNRYSEQQDNLCLNDVMILLKLVAIKTFGRQLVANLHGNDWLQFLESKGQQTPFMNHKSAILNEIYGVGSLDNTETKQIIELSRNWIKTHA